MTVLPHPAGYAEVTAAGELDFSTHRVLLDAVADEIDHGRARILLDMSRVTFCDSSGLGVLARVFRRTTERRGWLRVAAPAPAVRRTMEIANLDRMIPVYDTVADAARDL
ncbi:MAG TPA: STAS domain-containing protein [Pilimelia sp.]|nr:STAS domain-containing protein [Pilimelia sp.]